MVDGPCAVPVSDRRLLARRPHHRQPQVLSHAEARICAEEYVHADTARAFELHASPRLSDATREVYPFDFVLDITFTLDGAKLTNTAELRNGSPLPMPAQFGFHPAFRWPLPFGAKREECEIVFEHPEPADIRRLDDGLILMQRFASPLEGKRLGLDDSLFVNDALIFDTLVSRAVTYRGAPRALPCTSISRTCPSLGSGRGRARHTSASSRGKAPPLGSDRREKCANGRVRSSSRRVRPGDLRCRLH